MQLSRYASRPRLQTNALCRARLARVKGQGRRPRRLLCEECGDGELAADATSPVVHQACTAMSRERPEAALRSYGHFSRRRANDQHAQATFSNHNPASYTTVSLQGPLLTSKRTWCDSYQTSQLGFRGLTRVPRGWQAANSKSVVFDLEAHYIQHPIFAGQSSQDLLWQCTLVSA